MIKGSDLFNIVKFFGLVGGVVGLIFFHIYLTVTATEEGNRNQHRKHFAKGILWTELIIAIAAATYGLIYHVDWSQ